MKLSTHERHSTITTLFNSLNCKAVISILQSIVFCNNKHCYEDKHHSKRVRSGTEERFEIENLVYARSEISEEIFGGGFRENISGGQEMKQMLLTVLFTYTVQIESDEISYQ